MDVLPRRARITFYPRMKNPSIPLQLRQPWDDNGDRPGLRRSVRCGHPNPIGWLLIAYGSWGQRAARVSPRDNVEVPPHPGKIRSHPRIRNPYIPLRLQQPGDKNGDLPGRYHPARCGNPNSTWLVTDWLGLMEPARGESYHSGQRRGPAASEEIAYHHRIRNLSIYLQLTPTAWGRKQGSP